MSTVISSTDKKLPKWALYDNNPGLKKANVLINFSEEHIAELIQCAEDPIYFAEKYCYIIDPNKGKTIIKLRDYQKDLIHHFDNNRHTILMSGRQSGKSLLSAIYMTWYTVFHSSKKSAILANKERISKEIFNKTKMIYENLPFWMQPGVKEWNATSFSLDNGSDISCAATSSSAIRGLTISGCVTGDTELTVRNKETGEVMKITIDNFNKLI